MKLPYRIPETDADTLALAAKIVDVLVVSGVTFQKADDALSAAQEMLLTKARPVIDEEIDVPD